MKKLIFASLLSLSASTFACVDLSGQYNITAVEGVSESYDLILKQYGCEKMDILTADGTLFQTIIADGVERVDNSGEAAGMESTVESCVFTDQSLECEGHEVISAFHKLKRSFKRLENGNIYSSQTIPNVYNGPNTTFQELEETLIKK